MKKSMVMVIIVLLLFCLFLRLRAEKFDIIVPDRIEIAAGEAFCVDDFVEIKGNKRGVTLEYRDDIDINSPGTHTMDIIAEKNSETIEKTATVVIMG